MFHQKIYTFWYCVVDDEGPSNPSQIVKQTEVTQKVVRSSHVTQKCSVKKVFLKISQNSKENTCARVSLVIELQA